MGKKFKNRDIADRLGVSATLVSLVLNNKADQHGIKKVTQERVLALARQMGFFDSLEEKGEISPLEEKPGIIGMVVTSNNVPYVIGITPLLQKAFQNIGVGLSIITRDNNDPRFDRMIGAFKKFFSGLILVGDAADENTVRTLRSTEYPFIVLEKVIRSGRLNAINIDMAIGAQLIAEHIQKLGYKNILIATGGKSGGSDYPGLNEITDAIEKIPLVSKPVTIFLDEPVPGSETDFKQIEQFFRPPIRADIIITLQADIVYPLMTYLRKRNLRIPQDIAVISMEEGPGFDLMYTPVTSLRKPMPIIASKTVSMIWSEVKNAGKGKFKRQVNIPPELIIRTSCGTV